MEHGIPAGLEELNRDEVGLRFSGLDFTVPCTAQVGDDDDDGTPVPCCHVLEQLSAWNRFLWHVGLQLRELRAPGKLSLVRVVHMGSGGLQQELRSRDARLVFHVLLVRHYCVVSVELDEAVCEGSGFGEYRERVVAALQQSTGLRVLTLNSLFLEYKWIQEDIFGAIATMTQLQELVISGTGATPPFLPDAICRLLLDTTSLTSLSMSDLIFDEDDRKCLLSALLENFTIENLSLHGSIVHSYVSNGVSVFSIYLAKSLRLRSLSLEGGDSDPAQTYKDLVRTIPALNARGTLRKLKLSGYLLNAGCATVLALLVSSKDGVLEHLDLGGCLWGPQSSASSTVDARRTELEEPGPADLKPICPWLRAFGDTAHVKLSFLALSFAGLTLRNLAAIFHTAATVQFLGTISLRDVALHELKEVCRVIRDNDMSDRVRIEGEYFVDMEVLIILQEFPKGLRSVVIGSLRGSRREELKYAVRLACTWYCVTTLHLLLTQRDVNDVVTIRSLSDYLNVATQLRELALTGRYRPDLSLCLGAAESSYAELLEAIFGNMGIHVLRIYGFRLGWANLSYLADAVVASETLCEVSFESWYTLENEGFVRLLAAELCENKTICCLRVSESVDGETQEERFVVEDILGRNMGYVTCAAHFVVHDVDTTRCAEAFATVSSSRALIQKVEVLAQVDDAEARSMIRSILK